MSQTDGPRAWFTLACIFIVNATTLGSLKVYGLIFQEIVSQNYYNREEASWPISTASTIQNIAGLLTPLLALKLTWTSIELVQATLFLLANVGAYYSTNLPVDILCLGLIQGVALSIRYNMNIVINNDYFSKYRATAMGFSLLGSTCGVFIMKPLVSYVLDNSDHQFRKAYLAIATVSLVNILISFFIRQPKDSSPAPTTKQNTQIDESTQLRSNQRDTTLTLSQSLTNLLKNPSIHFIWIMQTVYFYISRTYTIFIVDYGSDKGLDKETSRNMLDFWVYGEITGRFLLGTLVDCKLLSVKWNLVLISILLSTSEFLLLAKPSDLNMSDIGDNEQFRPSSWYVWSFGLAVAGVGALSSLLNMLIIPFGQEYLGKKNVPWAFAIGSAVTGILLMFRPSLIGWSRDYQKSYDPLIIVMSLGPLFLAILFVVFEPTLKKRTYVTG